MTGEVISTRGASTTRGRATAGAERRREADDRRGREHACVDGNALAQPPAPS